METDSRTGVGEEGILVDRKAGRRAAVDAESNKGEADLIRLFITTRDPRAFEQLLKPHTGWLHRLLQTVFNGNHHDMEDARQEILMGICTDIGRFRFLSGFKTFFFRYARNKAIDILRKKVRRRKKETDQFTREQKMTAFSPEDEYVKHEAIRELTDKLLLLAPEDREMLLLKDVEDFTIDEIAKITGLKPGTVKSRLHRAREKIYRLMEGGVS